MKNRGIEMVWNRKIEKLKTEKSRNLKEWINQKIETLKNRKICQWKDWNFGMLKNRKIEKQKNRRNSMTPGILFLKEF